MANKPTLKTDLIGGPYTPPPVRRGDRATCLYRDCGVVITSWTSAPISWPRCNKIGQMGGSGLLVTEELVKAVKTESAEAMKFWFGVSTHTVWCWRKSFGVGMWETPGSRRLHQELSERGGAALKGKKLPRALVNRRMKARRAVGFSRHPKMVKDWKPEEIALLGTLPDEEVARKIGRAANGVRIKRTRLGIPSACDRRRNS